MAMDDAAPPTPQVKPTRYLYRPFPSFDGGGCHADVYLPSDAPKASKGWPVAMAIHGGAFGLYGAKQIPAHQIDHLTSRGIAVVSIEYRLAPHCTIYDQIDDCLFAQTWIRNDLNKLIEGEIDVETFGVFGASAGGYLALMVGQKTSHPPLAITSFYGISDWTLAGMGTSNRDAWKKGRTEEEVAYMSKVFTNPRVTAWIESPDLETPSPRVAFFRALMATGSTLANLLPPDVSDNESTLISLSPLHLATSFYPPTYLVVPTADQLVAPVQSYSFGEKLKELGVEHAVGVVEDAPHAFEWRFDDERAMPGSGQWWKDSEAGMKFLADHLQ